MIINDRSDVKKIAKAIKLLLPSGFKNQHIYEAIAYSQSFNTDAHFKAKLDGIKYLLDTSREANQRFNSRVIELSGLHGHELHKEFRDAVSSVSPLPYISKRGFILALEIDFENKSVFGPIEVYKPNFCSRPDFLLIGDCISKADWEKLKKGIVDEMQKSNCIEDLYISINSEENMTMRSEFDHPLSSEIYELPTDHYEIDHIIYDNEPILNYASNEFEIRKVIATTLKVEIDSEIGSEHPEDLFEELHSQVYEAKFAREHLEKGQD
ncbi:hypothetical protein [Pseudoalteromonas sp. CnMc7-37]|uniref:hypothetical protein n=1 Tax=Pseudoalteromonas sp. CnMc7-37 TaxID=2954496 RepID=UPI0020978DAA|nr:hypothetical protein [Pseudoalteromonas sp. CnMc7-37]MCO7205444.1 hypothetical protein [Pseudoalteromonas sp. CnMc7-37]|tara:strand:- start:263 stop:1063 length:801 start_codon:yes stop_codon:yes gene_type:complete